MRRLLSLLAFVLAAAFSLPAPRPTISTAWCRWPKDDIAAVAKAKAMPERHVMLYFGDHLN
jgi:hypothetical protein